MRTSSIALLASATLSLPLFSQPNAVIALTNGRWFDGASFQSRTAYSVDGTLSFEAPARIGRTIDLAGAWVVPPFAEAAGAPDWEAVSWHGLMAPTGTPKEIIDRLHGEMKRIMGTPEMTKRVADLGLIPFETPDVRAIDAYIRSEQQKWGTLVRKLGLEGTQ